MNRFHTLLTAFCILLTTTAWSQLKLNIKQLPDTEHWGVYVKPCGDIAPTANTITGSAQVTVVLPIGNDIENVIQYAGHWMENASVSGPDEAPTKNYISFGFLIDNPQIILERGKETLLFSFDVDGLAEGMPYLINNENDPFASLPNSVTTNPGNEISVLDMGTDPIAYYFYSGNYQDEEDLSCSPVQDTTDSNDNPTPTNEQLGGDGFFSLSPNPAIDWIKVDFARHSDMQESGSVHLWAASGISLGELEKSTHEGMTLNVAALSPGMYFISYEIDGEVLQRERFVKQ